MTKKDKKIIEESIINDTPIFVFTAKDKLSIVALKSYLDVCVDSCTSEHSIGILKRINEFRDWQIENNNKVKYPD